MKKILFLICLFSLSFYSCAIRNSLAPKMGLDAERTFIAQKISNGNSKGYFNIPTKLVKTSDHLAIYLQTTYRDGISAYGLNKMAQEFEYYYDDMTNIYGGHSDVDGNGKIIIVLMDINVTKSGIQTLGYFNPSDFFDKNRGEILYMDLSNANHSIDKSIGTLIHEFQHLINYSYVASGERGAMSSWLNETLSESTSILFNKATVDSRIGEFNGKNYYCFYTWKSSFDFNYPSASVFMNWLYMKSGTNREIFKKIAQSKESADYMKVLKAAQGISDLGVSSWEDLLLTWMSYIVTNCDKPLAVGDTNVKFKTNSGSTNLYPGAMVVYNGSYTSSGNNNIVARTNNGNIIVLNKDTTLSGATPIRVSLNGSSISTTIAARQSIVVENKKSENKTINILLDENGNIQND